MIEQAPFKRRQTIIHEELTFQEESQKDAHEAYYEKIVKKFEELINHDRFEIKFHHRRTHLIRREGKPLVIASCFLESASDKVVVKLEAEVSAHLSIIVVSNCFSILLQKRRLAQWVNPRGNNLQEKSCGIFYKP